MSSRQALGSRFIIYALCDPRDEAIRYVGKSSSGLNRPKDHIRRKTELTSNTRKAIWVRSLIKAGVFPTIEVLEEIPSHDGLDEAERFWISQIRALGFNLTNLSDGGEGATGVPKSKETRAKLSEAIYKFNASAAGIRLLEERGRKARGRKMPAEAVERGRLKRIGQHRSLEARLNMSISHGGKPFSDQYGNTYVSISEAARSLGISSTNIQSCLKGRRKSVGGGHKGIGYVFKYLDS